MSVPFDYIDGKKVDLSNQAHRDIVVDRNKVLQKAIKCGLDIDKIKIEVRVMASLDCVKCGSYCEADNTETWDFDIDIEQNIPCVRCSHCKTKYTYSEIHEVFNMKIPKPELSKIKKS